MYVYSVAPNNKVFMQWIHKNRLSDATYCYESMDNTSGFSRLCYEVKNEAN